MAVGPGRERRSREQHGGLWPLGRKTRLETAWPARYGYIESIWLAPAATNLRTTYLLIVLSHSRAVEYWTQMLPESCPRLFSNFVSGLVLAVFLPVYRVL